MAAFRNEPRQPLLRHPPEALGSHRAYKVKKQIAEIEAGGLATETFVTDAVTAHAAAADPHTQYTANDPALRS
jgi:hypothetical protein